MVTQLEGLKLDATVYNPGPQTYEAQLVPRIFQPWAERLIGASHLMAGERVLDLACGTGIVARTAAARVGPGGTVFGVDVNPAMLEVARRVSAGILPAIEYLEGNALSLPFSNSSFDVVICQQGLQFFTDRTAALREVRRVATPRGRALFAVWRGIDHHRAMTALDEEVMSRHLDPEVMQGSDAPFWLGDIEQVRSLFHEAGFTDVHIRSSVSEVRFASARQMLDSLSGAHAPLAGAIAQLGEAAREAMYADVEEAFSTYRDDDGVMFTMTSAIVHARNALI